MQNAQNDPDYAHSELAKLAEASGRTDFQQQTEVGAASPNASYPNVNPENAGFQNVSSENAAPVKTGAADNTVQVQITASGSDASHAAEGAVPVTGDPAQTADAGDVGGTASAETPDASTKQTAVPPNSGDVRGAAEQNSSQAGTASVGGEPASETEQTQNSNAGASAAEGADIGHTSPFARMRQLFTGMTDRTTAETGANQKSPTFIPEQTGHFIPAT